MNAPSFEDVKGADGGIDLDTWSGAEREIAREVHEERMRQLYRWGEKRHNPDRWLTLCTEKFGGAAKGVTELGAIWEARCQTDLSQTSATALAMCASRVGTLQQLTYRELIQLAATASAFAQALRFGKA